MILLTIDALIAANNKKNLIHCLCAVNIWICQGAWLKAYFFQANNTLQCYPEFSESGATDWQYRPITMAFHYFKFFIWFFQ